MYIYMVAFDCSNDKNESFWSEEFSVNAENEKDAITEGKIKARKKGYRLRWEHEARTPKVRRL